MQDMCCESCKGHVPAATAAAAAARMVVPAATASAAETTLPIEFADDCTEEQKSVVADANQLAVRMGEAAVAYIAEKRAKANWNDFFGDEV